MLYFHVGYPKAASTYVQKWALANLDWLKARGIDVPQAPYIDKNGAHTSLALPFIGLVEGQSWSEDPTFMMWTMFLDQIKGAGRDTFLTTENFTLAHALHGDRVVAALADMLSDTDYKIIVAVRPHAEMVQSLHNQVIKKGYYLGSITQLYEVLEQSFLHMSHYLSALEEHCGKERLAVYAVGKRQTTKRDTEAALCDALGLSPEGATDIGDASHNVGLSLDRRKQRWRDYMSGERPFHVLDERQKAVMPGDIDLSELVADDYFQLSESFKAQINERFASDVARLFDHYLDPKYRPIFP